MYGYVYKTTDLRNGKIYVGRHKSSTFDENYFGSGNIIKKLINKYSTDIFSCEILQECYSHEEMCNAEKYWIQTLNSKNKEIGYNLADGGEFGYSGGMTGHTQSEKQKEAARKAKSGPMSDETKEKLRLSHKGRKYPERKKPIEFSFKGHQHSEEAKQILSEKARLITTNWWNNASTEERINRGNNISKSKKGKIVITDGIKTKYINEQDWPKYESQGFYRMSLQAYKKLMNITS